jgi:hypothetical protein
MSGRTFGVFAGLALVVAQICFAPPVQAAPMHCPLRATGCPMRSSCSATAPQRAAAVTPKQVVVIPAVRHLSADVSPVIWHVSDTGETPALHRAPILVLRI